MKYLFKLLVCVILLIIILRLTSNYLGIDLIEEIKRIIDTYFTSFGKLDLS